MLSGAVQERLISSLPLAVAERPVGAPGGNSSELRGKEQLAAGVEGI